MQRGRAENARRFWTASRGSWTRPQPTPRSEPPPSTKRSETKTAGLYLTIIFKPYFSLVDPMAGGRLATSTANISAHHGCQGKKTTFSNYFQYHEENIRGRGKTVHVVFTLNICPEGMGAGRATPPPPPPVLFLADP